MLVYFLRLFHHFLRSEDAQKGPKSGDETLPDTFHMVLLSHEIKRAKTTGTSRLVEYSSYHILISKCPYFHKQITVIAREWRTAPASETPSNSGINRNFDLIDKRAVDPGQKFSPVTVPLDSSLSALRSICPWGYYCQDVAFLFCAAVGTVK